MLHNSGSNSFSHRGFQVKKWSELESGDYMSALAKRFCYSCLVVSIWKFESAGDSRLGWFSIRESQPWRRFGATYDTIRCSMGNSKGVSRRFSASNADTTHSKAFLLADRSNASYLYLQRYKQVQNILENNTGISRRQRERSWSFRFTLEFLE